MAKPSTIVLFDQDGNDHDYKLLSARLEDFYQAYPPKDGWQVIMRADNGSKFGLDGQVVFRATLLDKKGREINSGSSCVRPTAYKDWEKGETAARQRLLAGLGFGGEILDTDEDNDIKHQGLSKDPDRVVPIANHGETKRATQRDDQSTPSAALAVETPVEAPSEKADAEQAENSQPARVRTEEPQPQPAQETPGSAPAGERIPEYIINGINARRALLNLEPVSASDFSTEAEAKQEMKRLMTT